MKHRTAEDMAHEATPYHRTFTEKATFLTIFAAAAVYIVCRAVFVPVVHDEAATFFHYIRLETFLPGKALWDANNHLLNTVLAYSTTAIFGESPLALRLPNVLSFVLFAWYVWAVSGMVQHILVRICLAAALLTASFQLEFFALARGYGMSVAFLLGAIYHACRYMEHRQWQQQAITWCMMLGALLSNMSLFNTHFILTGLLFLYMIYSGERRPGHYALLSIGGGSILAGAAWYALKMKALGLLYTGERIGFVSNTIMSFVKYQFGLHAVAFAWCIAMTGLAACAIAGVLAFRQKNTAPVAVLAAGLLLLNALGAIVLEKLLGVNYPEERTGLYFLTLFILAVGLAADLLARNKPAMAVLAIPLLYFPLESAATANLRKSHLWYDIHIDPGVHRNAAALNADATEPLRISGRNMYALAWAYHNNIFPQATQQMEYQYFPDETAELIVAWPGRDTLNGIDCDTLYRALPDGFLLLSPRNGKLPRTTKDTLLLQLAAYDGTSTFWNLAQWQKSGRESGEISFSFKANADSTIPHAQFVITAQDSTGSTLVYDFIPLHWFRKYWNGETVRIRRGYHFPEATARVVVYFWNISGSELNLQVDSLLRRRLGGESLPLTNINPDR